MLLLLPLFFLIPASIAACSCPYFVPGPNLSKSDALRMDVVFVGMVIDSTPYTRTFKILQHIKGLEGLDTVISGSVSSCSTLYGKGYYIIYGSFEGDVLDTGYCSSNEKLNPLDYQHVSGSSDVAAFEKLLVSGIEEHNFHLKFLKDLFRSQTGNAKAFTVTKQGEWYRNYTVYKSLRIVGVGFLLMAGLFFFVRKTGVKMNLTRSLIRLSLFAAGATILSVMVYSELKPIGIGTHLIEQYYGFPKYIYASGLNTVSKSYTGSSFHYVNAVANFFVYFVLFGTVYLAGQLFRGKNDKLKATEI